jgi:hypothetical protein
MIKALARYRHGLPVIAVGKRTVAVEMGSSAPTASPESSLKLIKTKSWQAGR